MASGVAMMISGAVVNALAFTGGNFFILKTRQSNDADKERERHQDVFVTVYISLT